LYTFYLNTHISFIQFNHRIHKVHELSHNPVIYGVPYFSILTYISVSIKFKKASRVKRVLRKLGSNEKVVEK
jgi:hypothetical protein